MAVAVTKRKVAKTTKKLYRELAKGKDLTQKQISQMLWKITHKETENSSCPTSYWHGSLMNHVVNRRISKMKRGGKIIYRLNKTGRKYAMTKGMIKE